MSVEPATDVTGNTVTGVTASPAPAPVGRWAAVAGARRVAGFSVVPVLGLVSPLLALPLVTGRFGAPGWAAVAQGQALGAGLAVVIGLGWSLNGPQAVAAADTAHRRRIYLTSLAVQLPLFVLACAAGAAAARLLQPGRTVDAALAVASGAALGLSPSWFFVGLGRPGRVLLSDGVPKLVAVLAACAALAAGAGLWSYPFALLVAALVAPVMGVRAVRARHAAPFRLDRAALAGVVREQWLSSLGQLASTVYMTLPVVLIGLVSPASVALFAAADRLQRMLLNVLGGLPLAVQHWVGTAGERAEESRRIALSIWLNVVAGTVAGVGFWVTAPAVSGLVFANAVPVGHATAAWCGVIVWLSCVSRAVGGVGLVARSAVGWLTVSALAGAAVGVPALLLWTPGRGVDGALAALALAETVVLVVQVAGYLRAGLRLSAGPAPFPGRRRSSG